MLNNKNIFMIFLVTFLCLVPFFSSLNTYDFKRFIEVLFISGVVLYSVYNRQGLSIPEKFAPALSICFLLGLLSAVSSKNEELAILSLLHTTFLTLYFLLILSSEKTTVILNSLLKIIFIMTLSIYSICFLNTLISLYLGDKLAANGIYYGFANIRYLNQFQTITLPLLAYFSLNEQLKRLSLFLICFAVFLMLVGGARASILLWFASLGILFSFAKSRHLAINSLIASIIGITLYYCAYTWSSGTDFTPFRYTSTGRVLLWISTLQNLEWSNLLWGLGPGTFESSITENRPSHPHNVIIQIIYGWGGAVALIFSIFALTTLYFFYRALRKKQVTLSILIVFTSWLNGMLYSLVSGIFVTPTAQLLIIIIWALLINMLTREHAASFKIKRKTCLIVLLPLIAMYYFYNMLNYNCYAQKESKQIIPGYWSDGLARCS